MSWWVSYATKDALAKDEPSNTSGDLKEAKDQLAIAKSAAQAIIASKACGDPKDHDFNVNLSGHSNPKHARRNGFANDTIAITVSQKS